MPIYSGTVCDPKDETNYCKYSRYFHMLSMLLMFLFVFLLIALIVLELLYCFLKKYTLHLIIVYYTYF